MKLLVIIFFIYTTVAVEIITTTLSIEDATIFAVIDQQTLLTRLTSWITLRWPILLLSPEIRDFIKYLLSIEKDISDIKESVQGIKSIFMTNYFASNFPFTQVSSIIPIFSDITTVFDDLEVPTLNMPDYYTSVVLTIDGTNTKTRVIPPETAMVSTTIGSTMVTSVTSSRTRNDAMKGVSPGWVSFYAVIVALIA